MSRWPLALLPLLAGCHLLAPAAATAAAVTLAGDYIDRPHPAAPVPRAVPHVTVQVTCPAVSPAHLPTR